MTGDSPVTGPFMNSVCNYKVVKRTNNSFAIISDVTDLWVRHLLHCFGIYILETFL